MNSGSQFQVVIPQAEAVPIDSPDPQLLRRLPSPYSSAQCRKLLATLLNEIDWQHDYLAYGRRFDVPRVQAWYADPGVHYRYANNLLRHRDWIAPLLAIRRDVEAATGHNFNSVLATWYRNGHDHVTFHADDETELGEAPVIASLSLGATRAFQYTPKQGDGIRQLPLHDGDLLLMQPDFQRDWLHAVPVEPDVAGDRINLTFRQVCPA